MKSYKYKAWFYIFLFFEIFFLILNVGGGRDLLESLLRSTVSAGIIEVLIYFGYLLIFKERKRNLKGNKFDEKDSEK